MIDSASYQRIITDAGKRLHGGEAIDDILVNLKSSGFSQIDSIRAVIDITGASLADAKVVVHNSRAWEETREDSEDFHAEIASAVESIFRPD